MSLLWLTACSVSGPVVEAQTTNEDGTLVRWIDDPPNGCAVGSSGPTLNPRRSILNARLSAIEALAADSLAIDVQTVSGVGPDGSFEVSAQALSGTLADARVVALWADVDRSQQSRRRVQQVFALACWPDASTRDLPDVDYPQWLLEPPVETGRICAAGIAGPTWRPLDQPVSALRDARLALAAAIESRVEKRVFDDGHGVAKVARQIDPSRYALERAATAEELEMEWFDESGTGPIGLPGVLYGLACIDE